MTKQHWNTDDIIEAIKAEFPTSQVANHGSGGDVDTDNLQVIFPGGGSLRIRGFNTDNYSTAATPSDVDVEMVELSAGKDSRGGLQGVRDPEVSLAYGKLHAMLVTLGFSVVPCLNDYF